MRKVKIFGVLLLWCLVQNMARAQQAQGCVLPSNNKIIYTQKIDGLLTSLINLLLGGSSLYSESTATVLSNNNCSYILTAGGASCKVCPTGLQYNLAGLITGCSGGMISGYEGNYLVECNLDHFAFFLLPICCYLGIRGIKQQSK